MSVERERVLRREERDLLVKRERNRCEGKSREAQAKELLELGKEMGKRETSILVQSHCIKLHSDGGELLLFIKNDRILIRRCCVLSFLRCLWNTLSTFVLNHFRFGIGNRHTRWGSIIAKTVYRCLKLGAGEGEGEIVLGSIDLN